MGVELFSDSDRLSYTSLSRSSSLIQFESLERQLQNDTQNISGSSPSIFEGANVNCNNGTVQTLNQEISNSGVEKSAPIAINLPTIKITNPPQTVVLASASTGIQFTNSDSEPYSSGSTSGSFSSDDCELSAKQNDSLLLSSECKATASIHKLSETQKSGKSFRTKNSVDSLSEDSGYCDIRDIRSLPAGALSLDSSLPNSNDLEDEDGSVIEEKSILSEIKPMRNLSLSSRVRSHSEDDEDDDICYHSMESLNRKFKSRKIETNGVDDSKSLISAVTSTAAIATTTTTTSSSQRRALKIDGTKEQRSHEHSTMYKNKTENSRQSSEIQREKLISISSPELYENGDNSRKGARLKLKRNYRQSSEKFRDFCSVSSVPENLNLISLDREESWDENTCDTVASKNFNLFDLNYGPSSVSSRQKVDISASCANLTLLNYSDDPDDDFCYDSHKLLPINRTKTSTMNSKMPPPPPMYPSDEDDDDYIASYRSKELTSLLEEISAHFNKNLSILNDREASFEPQTDVRDSCCSSKCDEKKLEAPRPPPRVRSQIKTSPNHSAVPKKPVTFDQDPTNLKTTYTQSLEKCNFNVDEPVNVYSSRQNIYLPDGSENVDMKTNNNDLQPVHKRNFVSSTPNLNYFDFDMRHVQHYSSVDNGTLTVDHLDPSFLDKDDNRCTSMKEIPSSHSRASSTGILASHSTGGSRSGLSVSFCPIVSEISWQITHDDDEEEEEEYSDDVDMDPSAGDNFKMNRNDSLVNYYNNTDDNINDDDNDDDSEEDFDDFLAVGTSTASTQVKVNDDRSAPTQLHVNDEKHQDMEEHTVIIETISTHETSTPTQPKTIQHSAVVEPNKSPVSHKMLVDAQTASEKLITAESAGSVEMDTKLNVQSMTTVPQKIVNNDGRPTKSSKPKKSIFSRISSGFRFSFRGKKNKKLATDGVVHYPVETNNNKALLPTPAHSQNINNSQQTVDNKVCSAKSSDTGDFVYIPLKAPTNDNTRLFNSQNDKLASELHDKLQNNNNNNGNNYEVAVTSSDTISPSPTAIDRQSRSMSKQQRESPPRGNQVMGKPPLPKQPPRIVGTTTKRPSAQAPRASSTPREYDDGEFYHQNMVGNGLKQQYYSDRARTMDSSHKIGLIETNLDTDETIINGKTQSLMELGIGQNNNNTNRNGIMNRIAGMGGVQVMQNIDTNINSGNNSERGRPHKSMEFLLDKENHHIILVSKFLLFLTLFHSSHECLEYLTRVIELTASRKGEGFPGGSLVLICRQTFRQILTSFKIRQI